MPDVSLNEISLHYEVTGTGPPMLLLAGMMSDSASWAPLLPLLAPHFTLIRPDNRTTGRTTPHHYAEDGSALMNHLGHTRCHIVGHSLGGLIALDLLNLAGERAIDVTLLATAPIRLRRNIELFEALIRIRRSNAAEDLWLRTLFPWIFSVDLNDSPGAIDQAVEGSLAYPYAQTVDAMDHQLSALSSVDVDAISGPYAAPVQAVLAEKDQMIPLDRAQAALAEVPTHIVPAAGHSVHWDAPQAVADLIVTFAKR